VLFRRLTFHDGAVRDWEHRVVMGFDREGDEMDLEMQEGVVVEQELGAIVATAEGDVEMRLAAMEGAVAELRARGDSLRLLLDELKGAASTNVAAGAVHAGRKTLSLQTASLRAKGSVVAEYVEPGSLDTALASLSVEQRIAVKSEMMRSGLLS
jgi:hypothetical protein